MLMLPLEHSDVRRNSLLFSFSSKIQLVLILLLQNMHLV